MCVSQKMCNVMGWDRGIFVNKCEVVVVGGKKY